MNSQVAVRLIILLGFLSLYQNCGEVTYVPPEAVTKNSEQTNNPGLPCLFNGQMISDGENLESFQAPNVAFGQVCVSETRTCVNGALSGSFSASACSVLGPNSCSFNGQNVVSGMSVTAYQTPTVPFGQTCVSESRSCSNGQLNGSFSESNCTVGPPPACTFNGQTVASGASVTAYQASNVPFGQTCTSQTRVCTAGTLSGTYSNSACVVNPANGCTFNGQTISDGASVSAFQAATVPFGTTCASQSRVCSNGTLSGTYTATTCSVSAPVNCTLSGQTVAHGSSRTAFLTATVAFGQTCSSQARVCTNGVLSGTYTNLSCSVNPAASCTFNGTSYASGTSATAYQSATVPSGQTCVSQSRTCTDGTLSGTYTHGSCTVNAPPTVAMSSPVANATVSGTITLTATAGGGGSGGVREVQFYIDNVAFGTADTTSPYSIALNTTTLTNASHQVRARVTDVTGVSVNSPSITFTVRNSVVHAFGPAVNFESDLIRGFRSIDIIDLRLIDGNVSVTGRQAFRFLGVTSLSVPTDLVYYHDTVLNVTYVKGNVNADSGHDFKIVLEGIHNLTAANFRL